MAVCEVCGNDYQLSFEVIAAGNRHVFDSFECAIQKLAQVCAHYGCRIIGHGWGEPSPMARSWWTNAPRWRPTTSSALVLRS